MTGRTARAPLQSTKKVDVPLPILPMILPMSDAPPRISLAAATAIVIASMVGTGVFTSLGFQIAGIPSGFPVLMLWVVGGVVALCGALSYAELTAMMPRSGGEYHLVGQAYHPLIGFLAGWVSITAGFSAPIALMALSFGEYTHGVWPSMDARMAAYIIVIGLTILQLAGVRFVAKFQVSLTVLKVLLIVAFIVGACWLGNANWEVIRPKADDAKHVFSPAFATSLFWVMFSYSGWNGAVYVAGEMRNPQRNLPLALLFGTLVVMVLYVALNAVFLTSGDWGAMLGKPEVGLIAARNIFGERGGTWMGVLIAFGLLSTVNAMLWTGASTLRVIGRDMRALCWLDSPDRRGEPIGAILLMTNLVVVLLGTGGTGSVQALRDYIQALLDYIQALLQLSSVLVAAAVIWWRFRWPDKPRPYKVPLFPLPPLIFISVSGWMLWVMMDTPEKREQVGWGAATLLIGVLIYLFSRKEIPAIMNGQPAPEEKPNDVV